MLPTESLRCLILRRSRRIECLDDSNDGSSVKGVVVEVAAVFVAEARVSLVCVLVI